MPARQGASKRGWKVTAGAVVELYLQNAANTRVPWIWVNPSNQRLLFRLTPANDAVTKSIVELAAQVSARGDFRPLVGRGPVRRQAGPTDVVDISWSLVEVLGEMPSVEEAERLLAAALDTVLSLADKLRG